MRAIPPDLAAHLAGGATTLCHCWTLHRRDGARLGFTDHDRDLVLGGVTHAAGTGLDASEATASLGFAVGGGEVQGALVSAGITEVDVAAGRYDGASVETWRVDWTNPEAGRLLLDVATIGEVRRADGAFVAELRGVMHRLDEERGRVYRATCSAALGDRACRVGLDDPAYRAEGTVAALDPAGLAFATDDLAAFPDDWFAGGRLAWVSGANSGLAAQVRTHRARLEGGAVVELWQPVPGLAVGNGFALTAGCDKSFATCRRKFANGLNFRGFPHMPGNDFVLRVAASGTGALDGGSLFR